MTGDHKALGISLIVIVGVVSLYFTVFGV